MIGVSELRISFTFNEGRFLIRVNALVKDFESLIEVSRSLSLDHGLAAAGNVVIELLIGSVTKSQWSKCGARVSYIEPSIVIFRFFDGGPLRPSSAGYSAAGGRHIGVCLLHGDTRRRTARRSVPAT